MLKVGLIGCGGIGTMHAHCWTMLSDIAKLTAIADVNTDKAKLFADKCGAKVYEDAAEMLENEQLDIVDICLPTALHAEYILKAIKYVKNIIVEKPICLHESEAEQLLKAEKESGAFIQVGQCGRFGAAWIYLKDAIDSGKYGKIVSGSFTRISPKPIWVKDYNNVNKTGGVALDLHIHDVDFIRYLMGGDPDELDAHGAVNDDGILEYIWAAYYYKNSFITAEASWEYPVSMPFSEKYRVKFEKATYILDDNYVLTVYPEDGEPYTLETDDGIVMDIGINIDCVGLFLRELRGFTDAIVTGSRENSVPMDEAIAALKLAKRETEIIERKFGKKVRG